MNEFVHTPLETLTRAGPVMTDVRNWNPFSPIKDFVRAKVLRAANIFGYQR